MACVGCGKTYGQTYRGDTPTGRLGHPRNYMPSPGPEHPARKKKKKNEPIDQLEVFKLGMLKDFVNFYYLMDTLKIKIKDVEDWIALQEGIIEEEGKSVDRIMKQAIYFLNMNPRCPECNQRVLADHVNTMPCNQVDNKSKWIILCEDEMGCGWSTLIDKELIQFVQENRRKSIKTLSDMVNYQVGQDKKEK